MLGYGESSAPADVDAYRLKLISQDLAELLDGARLEQVIGVGHDWGATILSRFAIYHPERLTALAFLGTGASKPGTHFDLDGINEMNRKHNGFEMLGYISYISRDPSSHCMMEQNANSVMDLLFAADPDSWNQYLHPKDAFKSFVENGCRQTVGAWFPRNLRERHLKTFGKTGGYLGPSRYYMMLDQNLSVPDEQEHLNSQIEQPVLLVLPREPEASSQTQEQMLSAWTSNVTTARVDSGHWVHMERADEVNRALERILYNQ